MALKLTKETKSKAYQFMKALLKDGADGEQINQLVNDIGEHLDKDIAGEILLDLLRNPNDVHADVKFRTTWFGPFPATWFHTCAENWADFCNEHEIRGYMRFGGIDDWKSWRESLGENVSDTDLQRLANKSDPQLMVFEWWADDLITREARDKINRMYNQIKDKEDKR
jgi:hypothetical protein